MTEVAVKGSQRPLAIPTRCVTLADNEERIRRWMDSVEPFFGIWPKNDGVSNEDKLLDER